MIEYKERFNSKSRMEYAQELKYFGEIGFLFSLFLLLLRNVTNHFYLLSILLICVQARIDVVWATQLQYHSNFIPAVELLIYILIYTSDNTLSIWTCCRQYLYKYECKSEVSNPGYIDRQLEILLTATGDRYPVKIADGNKVNFEMYLKSELESTGSWTVI